jgi:hypothetical protein
MNIRSKGSTGFLLFIAGPLLNLVPLGSSFGNPAPPGKWELRITAVETSTCPRYCPCQSSHPVPEGHDCPLGASPQQACKTNLVFLIEHGTFEGVALDGVKFWVAHGSGGKAKPGDTGWGILLFDKNMNLKQRDAVKKILPRLFPEKWKSFGMAEGRIAGPVYDRNRASATVDGGKIAEIRLQRTDDPSQPRSVIRDQKYRGTARHKGIVLMPTERSFYNGPARRFEFSGTHGYFLTFEIGSQEDSKPNPGS